MLILEKLTLEIHSYLNLRGELGEPGIWNYGESLDVAGNPAMF